MFTGLVEIIGSKHLATYPRCNIVFLLLVRDAIR